MANQTYQVCLLLGSNIDPEKNLPQAIDLLRRQVTLLRASSVWQSPPIGHPGPDFLNMAVLIATPLTAQDLKETVLRPLEAHLGRVRGADKNAPRTIDIDIILFDGQLVDAELFNYAHRAVPVGELLPDLRSPQGEPLEKVAARLSKTDSIRLKSGVLI